MQPRPGSMRKESKIGRAIHLDDDVAHTCWYINRNLDGRVPTRKTMKITKSTSSTIQGCSGMGGSKYTE